MFTVVQLDTTAVVRSVAVSPTGAYMALGDGDGVIHLMTAADDEGEHPFNGFEGQPIEWADTPEPLQDIEWDDSTSDISLALSLSQRSELTS